MSYQSIFQRYEYKYIITKEQKKLLIDHMKEHMVLDQYGKTTIRNLYFDTDNFRLIRHSIEKPAYKEKLRMRCYKTVKDNDLVFVELKKKHESIVYKRREAIVYKDAMNWLCKDMDLGLHKQIEKEINYFKKYYKGLRPHVFLSYQREAYNSLNGEDIRITFDEDILWRQEDLALDKEPYGQKIIEDNQVLMEVKTSKAIPLWLTHFLTKEKIFKRPFSKYGHAYEEIFSQID